MREHGTHACYVWGPEPGTKPGRGCRCDECRAGRAAYERERKGRKAPGYVSAARARQHVRELSEAGVGLKTVSARSGVSHGTLWKLVYGPRGRGPSKRIRKATEDRLLAVTPADAADGAKVEAGPTIALVAQLVERGWTRTAIAREIGQQGPGLQLGSRFVTAKHARTIKGLLDKPVPPRRSRWGTHEVATPPEPEEPRRVVDDLPELPLDGDAAWMRRGACKAPDVPTWLFFPGRGDHQTVAAAKAVCATCPVTEECLAYAERIGETDGIWGGRTAKARRIARAEGQVEVEG